MGQSITIHIPKLQRSYLSKDSYVKWTVCADVGATALSAPWNFDTLGCLQMIDRIQVTDYMGSTLLEDISGFGALISLLGDTSMSHGESSNHWNHTVQAAQYTSLSTGTPTLQGFIGIGTAYTSKTIEQECCFPLFSFLGLLSTKYPALHNGFSITVTLAPQATAFVNATGAADVAKLSNVGVKDVYFCAQVLELSPQAEALVQSSLNGAPMTINSKSYRNFVGSIPANSSSYRLDLNLNVMSLTNILWCMRPAADITDVTKYSNSNRIKNYLQRWWFQYGSTILPVSGGLTGAQDCYAELVKSRHGWSVNSFPTLINYALFGSETTPANNNGKFACGLDLELVPGRSNEMICGLNTSGQTTSIFAELTTSSANARVDAWCEYDSFISVVPGQSTTVSF